MDNAGNTTTYDTDRQASYQPLVGQRYYWEDGQDFTRTITYHWEKDTFWGIKTGSGMDVSTANDHTEVDSNAAPLPRGPWVQTDAGAGQYAGYTFAGYNVNLAPANLINSWDTRDSHGAPPVFGYYTYNTYEVYSQGNREFYVNSVRADYSVPISFIGENNANVTVTSNANIVLKGNILSNSGPVSITSVNGSIEAPSGQTITSPQVTLSAATGIGDTGLITVRTAGVLNATTGSGGIQITDSQNTLTYGQITTNSGNVTLSADQSILPASASALIQGTK